MSFLVSDGPNLRRPDRWVKCVASNIDPVIDVEQVRIFPEVYRYVATVKCDGVLVWYSKMHDSPIGALEDAGASVKFHTWLFERRLAGRSDPQVQLQERATNA